MGARRRTLAPEQVERAKAGDPAALTELSLVFLPRIYGLALRITQREDLAQDASQETILRVLRGLHRLRDAKRLDAWVLTIAGNAARDLLGASRREGALDYEPPAIADDDSETQARQKALDLALTTLQPSERELFLLHTAEGVALRELAEANDTNENAMKARMHRIRAKVRSRALACMEPGGAL